MNQRLDWVQALRGMAALLVAFTHARYFMKGAPSEAVAEAIFRPGAMGVDLFFLISGFIMVITTASADGSAHDTVQFFIKRVARIWPVYAVLALIGIQIDNAFDYFLHADHVKAFVKSLLFLPVNPRSPPFFGLPYGLGWTLNFEMYFYLVFGISMLMGRFRWAAFFGWMILTLVALPWWKVGYVSLDVENDYGFRIDVLNQITNPMIWTFVAGVIIGLVYRSPLRMAEDRNFNYVLGAVLGLALWWNYSGLGNFHGITQWSWPLAIAFLCLAVYSKTLPVTVPRYMVWLGNISFSFYLSHKIAQDLFVRTLNTWGRHDIVQTWSTIAVTTLFAIGFGAIAHEVLERRLSEAVRRWLNAVVLTRFRTRNAIAAATTD